MRRVIGVHIRIRICMRKPSDYLVLPHDRGPTSTCTALGLATSMLLRAVASFSRFKSGGFGRDVAWQLRLLLSKQGLVVYPEARAREGASLPLIIIGN